LVRKRSRVQSPETARRKTDKDKTAEGGGIQSKKPLEFAQKRLLLWMPMVAKQLLSSVRFRSMAPPRQREGKAEHLCARQSSKVPAAAGGDARRESYFVVLGKEHYLHTLGCVNTP